MAVKKIVISPNNTSAMAFFDDLNRKKAEMYKKIEENAVVKTASKVLEKKTNK